jgi:DNA-binding NarL/FixJ family response regulator
MAGVRVLIADDHAVVRQGIRQILSDAPELEVVAEASNGLDVLEVVSGMSVDVGDPESLHAGPQRDLRL